MKTLKFERLLARINCFGSDNCAAEVSRLRAELELSEWLTRIIGEFSGASARYG